MDPRKRILAVGLLLLTAAVGILGLLRPTTPSETLRQAQKAPSPAEVERPPVPAVVEAVPLHSNSASPTFTTAEQVNPAAAPAIEITSRKEEFIEWNGALSYKGLGYIVTADASGLTAAFLTKSPRDSSPTISLCLDEVRVGKTSLSFRESVLPGRETTPTTLSFDRGSVLERVQCAKDSFEQDFLISELPAGRGAITIVERIGTTLAPPADGTRATTLQFGTKESGAFQISKAVAIDAKGRKLPLDLHYAQGRMEMTVPASWVEAASLPIVIDPVIGSPFAIMNPITFQGETRSAVVYASGPNEWLAVWYDQVTSTNYQVYAQRITAAGALVGSRISVSSVSAVNYLPAVAYSSGQNKYCVVWSESVNGATPHLIGRFVTATGTTPGPEFDLGAFASGNSISIASDGTNTFYAVGFDPSNNGTLAGVLISNTGSIIAVASPQPTAGSWPSRAYVAFSNQEYLASWQQGSTLMARGMNTSGTFLTPVTTVSTGVDVDSSSLSAGSNQFLLMWCMSNGASLQGRLVQPGTGSTINFTTAAFTIASGSAYAPNASYSSTVSQWFVARNVSAAINANLVTTSGVSGADQTVAPATAWYPKTAWNAATNDVLVIYEATSGSTITLTGIRFSLGSVAAPTNLVAVAGNASVSLTWDAVTGATSYKVFRSLTSGSFSPTPTATVTTTSFNDSGLANGTTYYYVVKAVVGGVDSAASNQAQAIPYLSPPVAYYAHANGASAVLLWSAPTGATSYNVLRSIVSGGSYSTVPGGSGITATTFTDSGLTIGTTYYYVVTANYSNGTSANSNQVSATPIATPTGLAASAGDGVVSLSWTGVAGAGSYYINRSTSASGPFDYIADSFSVAYSDANVLDTVTYYYCVQAVSSSGDVSANSVVKSATPQHAGQSSVLFVVGTSPIPAGTPDAAINTRLVNRGYLVVVKRGGGTGKVTTADANGKVLVLISGTVNPSDINNADGTNKFKTVSAPVMTWNAGTYSSLGMTGSLLNTDFGTTSGQSGLTVWNPGNPIITNLTSLSQPATVVNSADTFSWGEPGGFASIGAVTPSPSLKPVIFSYTAGDPMPGLASAPGIRIGFFMGPSTATNLNSTGQGLFDSAVQWATGAPGQPQAVWASISSGQVTLHWAASPGATTYQVRQSSSANGPFTVKGTVTGTSFVITGLTNGNPNYFFDVIAFNGNGQSVASSATNAVPNPATCFVGAFKGSYYLRRKLTTDSVDHWNSRVITATVLHNGLIVDPSMVSPTQGTSPWSITGPAVVSASDPQTSTSCTVIASDAPNGARGTAQLTYSIKVNIGTLAAPIWETVPPARCAFFVFGKKVVNLRFHFPHDDDKKCTQWFKNGYPNLFEGDATDTTSIRRTERVRLANDLTAAANLFAWDQAAIEFYAVIDIENSLTEKVTAAEGYWTGDKLTLTRLDAHSTRLESTQQFDTLNAITTKPGVLNIYLVHEFSDSSVGGITGGGNYALPNANPWIIMIDYPTIYDQGLGIAHEFGHALTLKHSNNPANVFFNPLTGDINNLSGVYQFCAPYYLMYGSEDQLDQLISEPEALTSRFVAGKAMQGTKHIVQQPEE